MRALQVDCFKFLAVYQDVEIAFILVCSPIGTEHLHFFGRVYFYSEGEPTIEGVTVFISADIACFRIFRLQVMVSFGLHFTDAEVIRSPGFQFFLFFDQSLIFFFFLCPFLCRELVEIDCMFLTVDGIERHQRGAGRWQ